MAKELPSMLAGVLRPPNSPSSSETVEVIRGAADTITTSESLSMLAGTPEGRVGYARCGYSEVGAGAGDDLYTPTGFILVTENGVTVYLGPTQLIQVPNIEAAVLLLSSVSATPSFDFTSITNSQNLPLL